MEPEKINGRTPEEIKRELRWAAFTCGSINCEDCEYYDTGSVLKKRYQRKETMF